MAEDNEFLNDAVGVEPEGLKPTETSEVVEEPIEREANGENETAQESPEAETSVSSEALADMSNKLASPENSLIPATIQYFTHAFDFRSRTTRSDYWWSVLGSVLLGVAIWLFVLFGLMLMILPIGAFAIIGRIIATIGFFVAVTYAFANILPEIARSVRRLRDMGLSPWFGFMNLVSTIGEIFFLIISLIPTTPTAGETPRQTEVEPKNVVRNWVLLISGIVVVDVLFVSLLVFIGSNVYINPDAFIKNIDNLGSY
jgi:uncharacterized membrane protein YhaH (DUF805 family)